MLTYRRWLTSVTGFALVAAFLLALVVALAIRRVRRPDFPREFGDPTLWTLEQPFRIHDRNCQVVIFGDSTAGTSIDPRVLTRVTGLTACNLASIRPVVDFFNTLPVDVFLANNPHPRMIVFQFGPDTFYRDSSWSHDAVFSPLVIVIRNMPLSFSLPRLLAHPAELIQFSLFTLQKAILDKPKFSQPREDEYNRIVGFNQAANGFSDLRYPPETACSPPQKLYGPADSAWIAQLHSRYEARGIAVIVRAAPIPACDPQLAFYQHDLAGRLDANVSSLPVEFFAEGGRHMTLPGAEIVSREIAHEIQAKIAAATPATRP